MTTPSDAQSFLMGNSVPGARFENQGDTVGGTITDEPTIQQQRDFTTGELKVWKDGTPQRQLVVTVGTELRDPTITDDDGRRRFYVKGELQKTVASAVRSAGATNLEVGGVLTITHTGLGVSPGRGLNPPKLYSATYVKPTAAAQSSMLKEAAPAAGAAPAAAAPDAGPTRPENVPQGVWDTLTVEARAAMAALAKK